MRSYFFVKKAAVRVEEGRPVARDFRRESLLEEGEAHVVGEAARRLFQNKNFMEELVERQFPQP